jgi:hypothetical protein
LMLSYTHIGPPNMTIAEYSSRVDGMDCLLD